MDIELKHILALYVIGMCRASKGIILRLVLVTGPQISFTSLDKGRHTQAKVYHERRFDRQIV